MNEILQKRIEEAAFQESSMYDTIQEKNAAYNAAIKVATFALQNQWISVEEALPDKEHDVLVAILNTKTNTYFFGFDAIVDDSVFLRDKNGFPIDKDYHKITHWMEISQPKGGDE